MKNSKYESHGLYKSPEYRAWYHMKDRCYNQNDKSYHRYGGRGITVCARWLYSFNNFYEDMGTRPFLGAQLDREENKGDYEPGNCRWVTRAVNMQNAGSAKLNMSYARKMRDLYKSGLFSQRALCYIYKVSSAIVCGVLNSNRWVENNG